MAKTPEFRSRSWFADTHRPDQTALYLERYTNHRYTLEELRSGKPIIGIAQTGSDLSPCNQIHVDLGRRPTAALDRNLAYLGLVEVLHGYPIDAVVLTTGCDKTTPACLMAAATVDIPAIVLSGGPMLDGYWDGDPLMGSARRPGIATPWAQRPR